MPVYTMINKMSHKKSWRGKASKSTRISTLTAHDYFGEFCECFASELLCEPTKANQFVFFSQAASPTGLLSLPDNLLGNLWPKGHLLTGMCVSKGLFKLLPANVSDVVLRIKLDRADDRFDREHSTDWDYKCIEKNCTPERMAKSLGYFQSIKGFGLSMTPNGGRKHFEFSNEYRPSVLPWWFERYTPGHDLFKRDLAFDKVVDSFHIVVYGGHLKNLVSLHINVEMDSRALVLLIDSNQSTLKSITLDGTEIPKRERMSGNHVMDVVDAIQCCGNLQCLNVVDWFHEDDDWVLSILPRIVPWQRSRDRPDRPDSVGDHSGKIPMERIVNLLGYSQSTKGFNLCMTRNAVHMIINTIREQSRIPVGEAPSRDMRGVGDPPAQSYMFKEVINSLHAAMFNGGFKNLASIHIDVAVSSRGLWILFNSNRDTLKSVTLDGTE